LLQDHVVPYVNHQFNINKHVYQQQVDVHDRVQMPVIIYHNRHDNVLLKVGCNLMVVMMPIGINKAPLVKVMKILVDHH
jgi:hypothetical protein